MSKRIISIHAHPDDAEILAGGTLALLAARGHHITIVTMTPGDKGSRELSPDEISEVRRNEARNAASLIGAEYRCAEFRDLGIFNDDAARRRVVELLRQTRPDVVLTSSPVDYLCDHEATSVLVRDACFAAPAPNYRTLAENPAPPLAAIPHLYFMDAVGGVDREGKQILPGFVVDIAGTFETKRNMLAEHKSQRLWLQQQHNLDDYIEAMARWTRLRGKSAWIEYGEGFRRYKGHPFPETALLEQLLDGAVRVPA